MRQRRGIFLFETVNGVRLRKDAYTIGLNDSIKEYNDSKQWTLVQIYDIEDYIKTKMVDFQMVQLKKRSASIELWNNTSEVKKSRGIKF